MTDFALACPRCGSALPPWISGAQACAVCGATFAVEDGLYRFLLPGRLREIEPFLEQYHRVRECEGYRSPSPGYYRALPEVDARDPLAETWRVRRASFDTLCQKVLPRFDRRPLAALDLGAGNGWLCHRLAALGCRCAAVDWLADDADGLGARRHYPAAFACFQADFDALPFAPAQFDLAIFNASLHYAPDPVATLERAARMLTPGGVIAVLDSPTFRAGAAGPRMLAEKEAAFKTRYGLADVIQPGIGYLTPAHFARAGRALGMAFRFVPSSGGTGWEIRRWIAGLRRGREPARFGVWMGVRRGENSFA